MTNNEKVVIRLEVTDSGAIRVLNQAGDAVNELGTKTKTASSGFSRFGASIVTINQGLELFKRTVGTAAREVAQFVREGATFERQITALSNQLKGDATRSVASLKEGILELTKTIPKTPDELGAAAMVVLRNGITDTDEALRILAEGAKLSIATMSDTSVATSLLADAMDNFGLSIEQVEDLSAALFVQWRDGEASIEQIAGGFGRLALSANAVGVTFSELAAAQATLTAANLEAGQAQAGLRLILQKLVAPGKELKAVYKEIGVASGEALIAQYGLVGAIEKITGVTGTSAAALSAAFGPRSAYIVDALAARIDDLKSRMADMDTAPKSFAEAVGRLDKDTRGTLNRLSAAWQTIRARMFDALGPTITNLIAAFAPQLQELAERSADLIPIFTRVFSTIVRGGAGALLTLADLTIQTSLFAQRLKEMATGDVFGDTPVQRMMIEWDARMKQARQSLEAFRLEQEESARQSEAHASAVSALRGQFEDLARQSLSTAEDMAGSSSTTRTSIAAIAAEMERLRSAGVAIPADLARLAESFGIVRKSATSAGQAKADMADPDDINGLNDLLGGTSTVLDELKKQFEQIAQAQDPIIQAASITLQLRQQELTSILEQGAAQDVVAAKVTQITALTQSAFTSTVAKLEAMRDAAQRAGITSEVERLNAEIQKTQFEFDEAGRKAAALTLPLDAALKTIEDRHRSAIELARTNQEIGAKQLEIARTNGASVQEQVGLLKQQKEAALAVAEATIALLEEQKAAADKIDPGSAKAQLLAAQLAKARLEVQGINSEFGEMEKSISTVRVSLGEAFRQGMSDSLQAVVNGTRKMKDVWKGVKVSIIRTFTDAFAESLIKKAGFDKKIELNVGQIGQWFSGLGTKVTDAFSGIFNFIGGGFSSTQQSAQAASASAAPLLGTITPQAAAAASAAPSNLAIQGPGLAAAGPGMIGSIGLLAGSVYAFKSMVDITGSTVGKVFDLFLKGEKAEGAAEGAATGAKWGALAFGIGAFVGAIVGAIVGAVKSDSVRKSFEKDLRGALTKMLRDVLVPGEDYKKGGYVISRKAYTVGERLRRGRETSDTAMTLGLLMTAGIKSPFSDRKTEKVYAESAGKIQAIFERFPEKAAEVADTIRDKMGFGLGKSVDIAQKVLIRVINNLRGTKQNLVPGSRTDSPDTSIPGAYRRSGFAGQDRGWWLKVAKGQADAEQQLAAAGFIMTAEEAVSEVIRLFSDDLPRVVRNASERIASDAFASARASDEGRADTAAGRVVTVKGSQIEKAVQLETEAFAALADMITKASQSIIDGTSSQDVIKQVGLDIRDTITARASEGLQEAFFKQADFENLLSPLFFTLDRGISRILEAETPEQAMSLMDSLIGDMGGQFEAVAARIETLGPVIERFAKLQEELRLSLTSFAQAADFAADLRKKIDLLVADLMGDPTVAARTVVEQTQKARDDAMAAILETTLGFTGRSLEVRLGQLDDNDLKRFVDNLNTAADAIVANADAQISALETQLALTQQWVALLDQAKSSLTAVTNYGRGTGASAGAQFEDLRSRLGELIKQFRSGTKEDRVAAAQAITQLAPQLLQSAETAGFLPGSSVFEQLRGTLETILGEIVREGTGKKDEALDIQKQIKAVQQQAVTELKKIAELSGPAEKELRNRSTLAIENIDKNMGADGTVGDLREDSAKILDRLHKGINTFIVGSKHKQEKSFSAGDFSTESDLPTGASGGIFKPKQGLALLHGPEAIVPLKQLPKFLGSLDKLRPRTTDTRAMDAMTRAISRTSRTAQPLRLSLETLRPQRAAELLRPADRQALTSLARTVPKAMRTLASPTKLADFREVPREVSSPSSVRKAERPADNVRTKPTVNITANANLTKNVGRDDTDEISELRRLKKLLLEALRDPRIQKELGMDA